MRRLERILQSSFSGPIFVKDGEGRWKPDELSEAFALVDCGLLIEPWHLFSQIAEILWRLPRDDSIAINSPQAFLDVLRKHSLQQQQHMTTNSKTTVILLRSDVLLAEDPMVLWTLLQLSKLLPELDELPLRLVLVSRDDLVTFQWVLDDLAPLCIDASDVGGGEGGKMDGDVVEEVVLAGMAATAPTVPPKDYPNLVRHIYSIVKDLVTDRRSLQSLVRKILPIYLSVSQRKRISLADTAKLYQHSLKPISALLNGETLREIPALLIDELSVTERFLLIAAFLASHNPAKFDLRLFGNVGRRARTTKATHPMSAGKAAQRQYRLGAKAFPLDRLLAIFYFLAPSQVPVLSEVLPQLSGLVRRGLLQRVTLPARLDYPKFRCALSIDIIGLISRSSNFEIGKYLMINY